MGWKTGVRFSAWARMFSLRHCVQNGCGAHPASYSMLPRASSPGVKRLGREADYLLPSSDRGAMPPLYLYGMVLSFKHRDSLRFCLVPLSVNPPNNCLARPTPPHWTFIWVYPKVSGLATWRENCKWHNFLPRGAVVSLFYESVSRVLAP
jgi:hypothetical protein